MHVIERWWRVVKDKRVFHMLKQAICAAVSNIPSNKTMWVTID